MATEPKIDLATAVRQAGAELIPQDQDFDDDWNRWEASEASGDDGSATPEAPGEPAQTADNSDSGKTPEAGTVQEDDIPTEFWGVDLSDIPAEARAEILKLAEQQETTIHKLQARLAEKPEPAPAPEPEEVVELSDEDILRGLGFDPDDYSLTESSKVAMVQMGRAVMALEDKVESMSRQDEVTQVEVAWNKALDDLESEFGKLPGTRQDVLRFAVEENIVDPAGLYFRLTAKPRAEIDKAVAEARRDALKAEARGGVKPRAGAAEPSLDLKGLSMREAIEKAARSAEKETGVKWRDSLKRQLTQRDENLPGLK